MSDDTLGRYHAIAAFPTFQRAREALGALEQAGFGATELSLVGPEHEMRPEAATPTEHATTGTSGIGKAAVAGGGAGAVTGGALGVLGGLALTLIPGVGLAAGAGALYGVIFGAGAGHVVGALTAAEKVARENEAWEAAIDPLLARVRDGAVLVGVHSDDEQRAAAGEDVLSGLGPDEVKRIEAA